MNKKWTEEEKNFIRINCQRMKDKELAAELTKMSGRIVTIDAVRKMRQKLNLKKKSGRGISELVEYVKVKHQIRKAD